MKNITIRFIALILLCSMNLSSIYATCPCDHTFGSNSSSDSDWSDSGFAGSGTVVDTKFCVNGNLNIDVDARFRDCYFYMSPGSSITVTSGSLFKASGTHFYRCGSAMWNGILVNSGTIDFNHNWIYDAIVGIDNPNGQPMIQFIQNTFDRCNTGIAVTNLSPARPFVGNQYLSNGTLQSPYASNYPEDGMWLYNCNITERSGIYDHMNIGIHATNSILIATNNKMSNSTHTAIAGYHSDLKVIQCRMRNYDRAIWAEDSELEASNNYITNVVEGLFIQNCVNRTINTNYNVIDTFAGYGIVQRNCSPTLSTSHDHNIITCNLKPGRSFSIDIGMSIENDDPKREDKQAEITNNIVSITNCTSNIFYAYSAIDVENVLFENNTATYSVASDDTREGLYAVNCKDISVHGNNFTGGGNDTPSSFGMDIFNVENGLLCCNTVTNLNVGVYFTGSNLLTKIRGTNFAGPFQEEGLFFDWTTQSIPQLFAGNDWTGSAPFDAVYNGPTDVAIREPFIIAGMTLPYWPDDTPSGPVDWFRNDTGDDLGCGDDPDCNGVAGINGHYPNDTLLLTTGYSGDHASGLAWQARKSMLRRLWLDPDLGDGIDQVDSFRTANTSTTLGKIARLSNAMSKLFHLSSEWSDSLQHLHLILGIESDSIFLADSMFETETGDPEYWESFRVNHLNKYIDTSEIYLGVVSDHQESELDTISLLLTFISTISPTTIRDTNDLFVSKFYLARLLDSETTPETTDIDTLESIANQCPLDGGDAVLRARAILKTLDPEYFNPGVSCSDVMALRVKKGSRINESILVYPNPNNGTFNIQLPKNELKENYRFTLSNLEGTIIFSKEIKDQNSLISLSLAEGLYFIRLISVQNHTFVTKVLIR